MENLSAEWISYGVREPRGKTGSDEVGNSQVRTSCTALLRRIRRYNSSTREDLISSELLPSFIRDATPVRSKGRLSKYSRSGNPTFSLRAYIIALIVLAILFALFAESTSLPPAPLSTNPTLVDIAPNAPVIMREPPSVLLSTSVSNRPAMRQMPTSTLQFRPLEQLSEEEKARLLLFFALMKQRPKVIGNLAMPAESKKTESSKTEPIKSESLERSQP